MTVKNDFYNLYLKFNMEEINKKIAKLNEFGVPQKGGIPPFKILLDFWIFYNKNKRKINNLEDDINININFYIDER